MVGRLFWKTQNGGKTFTMVNYPNQPPIFDDFHSLYFTNSADTGFAFGWEGVMRTTDSGASWTQIDTLTIRGGDFFSGSEGVFWHGNEIWKTSDGTNSWQQISSPSPYEIRHIEFIDPQRGFISYTDPNVVGSAVYKTLDGGNTWTPVTFPSGFTPVWVIEFFDTQNGYMEGGNGKLARTNNGGSSWTVYSAPGNLYKLDLISPLKGFATFWVTSSQRNTFATQDGGQTWIKIFFDELHGSESNLLTVDGTAWAFSGDGYIPDIRLFRLGNVQSFFNSCPVSIDQGSHSVCDSVFLSATSVSNPQWVINGIDVQGAMGPYFSTNQFNSGNNFRVRNDMCYSEKINIAKHLNLSSLTTDPLSPFLWVGLGETEIIFWVRLSLVDRRYHPSNLRDPRWSVFGHL